MAQKKQRLEDGITLSAEALGVVSYADYFTQAPLFTTLRIENGGTDAIADLILSVTNDHGLLVSCVKPLEEIPFESTVEVELGNILSPLYFVGLEEVREEEISVELRKDKQLLG